MRPAALFIYSFHASIIPMDTILRMPTTSRSRLWFMLSRCEVENLPYGANATFVKQSDFDTPSLNTALPHVPLMFVLRTLRDPRDEQFTQ